MRKFLFFSSIILAISSCSFKVNRTGYQKTDTNLNSSVAIPIQRYQPIPDSVARVVGEIKLGESGFSTRCKESDAIHILQREAATVGADLINIVEEKRPDVISSCYRCKATFYKYIKPGNAVSGSEWYAAKNIDTRAKEDRKKTTALIWGGVIGGIIGGFLASQLY